MKISQSKDKLKEYIAKLGTTLKDLKKEQCQLEQLVLNNTINIDLISILREKINNFINNILLAT